MDAGAQDRYNEGVAAREAEGISGPTVVYQSSWGYERFRVSAAFPELYLSVLGSRSLSKAHALGTLSSRASRITRRSACSGKISAREETRLADINDGAIPQTRIGQESFCCCVHYESTAFHPHRAMDEVRRAKYSRYIM